MTKSHVGYGVSCRHGHWFDTEMDKLDRWAEDRRASLRAELAELDEALKDAQKDALLDTISQRLTQHLEHAPLFALQWRLV